MRQRNVALLLTSLLACSTPGPKRGLEERFMPLLESHGQLTVAGASGTAGPRVLTDSAEWKRWSILPEADRRAAQRGDVHLGMHELAVLVAWGRPARRALDKRRGGSVELLTYIRCATGLRRGRFVHEHADCDGASDTRELALRGGIVVDIRR